MIDVPDWAGEVVADLPYPMIFATVSGAHLYGFASVDSDLDLRGVHALPATEVVGLRTGPETLRVGGRHDGTELDLVSHDLLKVAQQLLSRNGHALEQLFSPLVVQTSAAHAQLTALAPGLLTRMHAHHYLGFAATEERLFARTGELKAALSTVRALLTGMHLVRTGEVVANLSVLYAGHGLAYLPELIAAQQAADRAPFSVSARAAIVRDVPRLRAELLDARDASHLPSRPDPAAVQALHDLVVQVRLS